MWWDEVATRLLYLFFCKRDRGFLVVNVHAISFADALLATPAHEIVDHTWPRAILIPER